MEKNTGSHSRNFSAADISAAKPVGFQTARKRRLTCPSALLPAMNVDINPSDVSDSGSSDGLDTPIPDVIENSDNISINTPHYSALQALLSHVRSDAEPVLRCPPSFPIIAINLQDAPFPVVRLSVQLAPATARPLLSPSTPGMSPLRSPGWAVSTPTVGFYSKQQQLPAPPQREEHTTVEANFLVLRRARHSMIAFDTLFKLGYSEDVDHHPKVSHRRHLYPASQANTSKAPISKSVEVLLHGVPMECIVAPLNVCGILSADDFIKSGHLRTYISPLGQLVFDHKNNTSSSHTSSATPLAYSFHQTLMVEH